MEDHYKDLIEAEKEDLKLLAECKEEMSDKDYEIMVFSIDELGFTHSYEFVKKPIGNYQEEDNYWVNQTTNGGFTGDEFAGTLCFKVKKGKYLKIHYSM